MFAAAPGPTGGTNTLGTTTVSPVQAHKLGDTERFEQVLCNLELALAEQERRFHLLAREVEMDDDRIAINSLMLHQLQQETHLVELLHMESVKDVEVSRLRLCQIQDTLRPMANYLDCDQYMRSIDPHRHENQRRVTSADEKRMEMYTMARSVGDELRTIDDRVRFMAEQISQRNQRNSSSEEDPLQEITKALNLQLASLNWAERKSLEIQQRVTAIRARRGLR